MLATPTASSTVDTPQSASNAIYHSYPSESRGGPGPTWLSEGGWAGGGGGKKEFEGVGPLEGSPSARRRRAALEDGGTDERLRSEGTPSENAWPRAQPADGGRSGTEMETGTATSCQPPGSSSTSVAPVPPKCCGG